MRSVSPLYYLSRSILSPGINALVLYHLCFVSSPSAELRIGVCHQLNRITFPRNLSLAHLPNFQTLTPLMQYCCQSGRLGWPKIWSYVDAAPRCESVDLLDSDRYFNIIHRVHYPTQPCETSETSTQRLRDWQQYNVAINHPMKHLRANLFSKMGRRATHCTNHIIFKMEHDQDHWKFK